MKSDAPLVSTIMPVYNGATYIAEAVNSIQSQRHRPLEIIIIDDGSTDTTAEVVRGIASQDGEELGYIYQPNQGPAAARNRGLGWQKGITSHFSMRMICGPKACSADNSSV